jgi:phage protein U
MRVGRRPAMQFMGPGVEELRIHGIIYPHAYGGYSQLNGIRSTAMTGMPLGLADAKGIYYGPWCIRMVLDEQEYFHPNGDPRRVEFDLDLAAYGT